MASNAEAAPIAHPALTVTAIVWSTPVANGVALTLAHVLGEGAGLGLAQTRGGDDELPRRPTGQQGCPS
jgi:hypothetical protein